LKRDSVVLVYMMELLVARYDSWMVDVVLFSKLRKQRKGESWKIN